MERNSIYLHFLIFCPATRLSEAVGETSVTESHMSTISFRAVFGKRMSAMNWPSRRTKNRFLQRQKVLQIVLTGWPSLPGCKGGYIDKKGKIA